MSYKKERIPHTCFWEITHACNLRCIHCIYRAGKAMAKELSTVEALTLADDLAASGCKTVCITGGEPLLRPDWAEIAQRLATLDMEVNIATNGILVDSALIQLMTNVGVSGVAVSIDGSRGVHDEIRQSPTNMPASCYDTAVAAIEQLVASPLSVAVITQIHRRNLDAVGTLYQEMVSLAIDAWQVQLAVPLGRLLDLKHEYLIEPPQIATLIDQISRCKKDGKIPISVADNIGYFGKREPTMRVSHRGTASFWSGCKAGCEVVGICPDGRVKGCPAQPEAFSIGSVRDTPLGQLWADAGNFAYNTQWDETLLEGKCAHCPYRRLCRAGCTSMAYATTGTIYDNPFCLQHQGCETADK